MVPVTPRLVATDLDGTLVRTDGTVSERTQQVLIELDKRGVPVIFVTGRPLRWATDVFDHVGGHGLAVISNGALVWDVAGRQPLRLRTIEPDVGLEVCRRIREAIPGSAFAVETLEGIALEPEFLERHPVPDDTPARSDRPSCSPSPRSRCSLDTRSWATRSTGTGQPRPSATWWSSPGRRRRPCWR